MTYHILFDCGIGAIDSLIDFGSPPVDQVFISHGHAYHSLGLDRLAWGQIRHGGRIAPLPVHCTMGTFDRGPNSVYPAHFKGENPRLVHVRATPPQPAAIEPDPGIGLKVTPVSVYQGHTAPGAVIWVVEFGSKAEQTYHKLVLGWEFIHFDPPFKGEDGVADAEHSHLDELFGDLFNNVDELFFDGNTRTPVPATNHMSIQGALRFLIPEVKPKRTWITHYSGHEDPGGPMSDEDLQDWVNEEKRSYDGLVDAPICVAKHGMLLAYEL